jgi:hypothetical protein
MIENWNDLVDKTRPARSLLENLEFADVLEAYPIGGRAIFHEISSFGLEKNVDFVGGNHLTLYCLISSIPFKKGMVLIESNILNMYMCAQEASHRSGMWHRKYGRQALTKTSRS